MATKIEKLRKALVCRQLNVNIRFIVILRNAFYTYKSDFSSVKCILFHVEIFFFIIFKSNCFWFSVRRTISNIVLRYSRDFAKTVILSYN